MNDAQLQRHARHVLLEGWGIEAQTRVLNGHALVVGAGGLGSPAVLYLAAAGAGRITLLDDDRVDATNLARQVVHTTASVGQLKADSAHRAVAALNPDVQLLALAQRADAERLAHWVPQADVVLDCSDNFATRQAINAACVAAGTPLVWAAAVGWGAQAGAFWPADADSPCYACLFPPDAPVQDAPCAVLGVFSPLVGQVGVQQAGEALRVLAGQAPALHASLWQLDGRSLQVDRFRVRRAPHCPVCAERQVPVAPTP